MSTDVAPEPLVDACRRYAQLGATTATRFFGSARTTRKADDTPVTQADHAAQAAILDAIAAEFPGHAVLTEEDVVQPARHAPIRNDGWCWVIDPIDGTRNFARGIALYAASVAVMRQGRPVAGAIYDAAFNRTFSAAAGRGAFLNGRPLTPEEHAGGPDATIMVSSFRRAPMPPTMYRWMDEYLFRNLGSLCLHLAWVAGGFAEAACSMECKLWDLAAGILIAEESGATATTTRGDPIWPIDVETYDGGDIPILVGRREMHARLLRALSDPAPPA